tara:strand:+ start:485 stop:826 length:342 start_codon:yes stop_codon:yes gene_type:complete
VTAEQYNECLKLANLAIKRLENKIAELEKERDAAVNRVEMCNLSEWSIYQKTNFGKKMLAIRDLEQQAKACDRIIEMATISKLHSPYMIARDSVIDKRDDLRNQAKELKEQGK